MVDDEEANDSKTEDPDAEESGDRGGGANFLDEELIPALVLVGVILFIVPEPFTSTLGIVLVGIGVGMWVYDLFRQ